MRTFRFLCCVTYDFSRLCIANTIFLYKGQSTEYDKITLRTNMKSVENTLVHFFSREDLATEVSYDVAMKKRAQRSKSKKKCLAQNKFKNRYHNIGDLGDDLTNNPEKLEYSNKEKKKPAIRIKIVRSSSKHQHIIFYNEDLLKEFTEHENFMDGTFKCRPQVGEVAQLLTIMGRKNDEVRKPNSIILLYLYSM